MRAYRLLSVDPVAEGYLRRLDTPLVGRDAELAELLSAFDRVAAGRRCELTTIVAPPGVGKSRLTNEVAARVAGRGRVLIGRCLPYGDGITFWPVAEAVKDAAGIRDEDSPEAAASRIRALVSGEDAETVAARIAAAVGIGTGEGLSLQETFWAVRRLLESLAEHEPVAFVVEDVHWAEPALLDLLQYLVEFTREHPLLIVCNARPELTQTRAEWLALGTTITLERLSDAQSETLVRHLVGEASLPPDVVRHVVSVAEGNALFVEELVRKLIDDGSLVRTNAHWEMRGELAALATPGTISALLAARIDGLADGERSTIQCGAVVGRVFWWGAVETIAPEPERPAVGRHLQTLVRRGLIQPDHSSFSGEDAFSVRPHPRPRRRLRLHAEGDPCRSARAVRRVGSNGPRGTGWRNTRRSSAITSSRRSSIGPAWASPRWTISLAARGSGSSPPAAAPTRGGTARPRRTSSGEPRRSCLPTPPNVRTRWRRPASC